MDRGALAAGVRPRDAGAGLSPARLTSAEAPRRACRPARYQLLMGEPVNLCPDLSNAPPITLLPRTRPARAQALLALAARTVRGASRIGGASKATMVDPRGELTRAALELDFARLPGLRSRCLVLASDAGG